MQASVEYRAMICAVCDAEIEIDDDLYRPEGLLCCEGCAIEMWEKGVEGIPPHTLETALSFWRIFDEAREDRYEALLRSEPITWTRHAGGKKIDGVPQTWPLYRRVVY